MEVSTILIKHNHRALKPGFHNFLETQFRLMEEYGQKLF